MTFCCVKCGEWKVASEYYGDGYGGLRKDCKACVLSRQKRAYLERPDVFKARMKSWARANRDRLREYRRRRSRAVRAARGEVWRNWTGNRVLGPVQPGVVLVGFRPRDSRPRRELVEKRKVARLARRVDWERRYLVGFLLLLYWVGVEREREREEKRKRLLLDRERRKVIARAKRREYERLKGFRRRGAGGRYTKADIDRLFLFQGGKCVSCRCRLKPGYHVDHILPIALGGTNDPQNLQLLCRDCNIWKGAKHPVEYMQSRGFLL